MNNYLNILKSGRQRAPVLVIAAAITMSACATDDNKRARNGAILGGLVGAVAGVAAGDDTESAVLGALAGALVGGAVGAYQDKQQRELEAQLADELESDMIEIQRLEDETLKVSLSSQASFDVNSSALKTDFLPALNRMGIVLQEYDKTAVHVIGYTDSTGSDAYNQELSTARAVSVADYARQVGLSQERLNTEGRGETEPRASNGTVSGRQANRRVEIYLIPVVEGQEEEAFESPDYN